MQDIDTKKLDPNFKFEIAAEEGGEGILKCYACGSCTVRCPEQEVKPEYNPREIIRKAILGLRDEVFRSEFVWICSSHFLCLSKCPQDVNIKGVMNAVRNRRIEEETFSKKTGPEPLTDPDMSLKYEVAEQECGADLYHCFACGACTAGCPERSLDEKYSPRSIIRGILLGNKEEVFQNRFLDICSTHYRCLEECPQGVEIPRLMTAIRRLAEAAGYTREGKKVERPVPDEKEEKRRKKKGEVRRVYVE